MGAACLEHKECIEDSTWLFYALYQKFYALYALYAWGIYYPQFGGS
jgi:hypothetical protein